VAPVESFKSFDFVRSVEHPDATGPAVLVIGTLDTKAEEIGFLAEAIVEAGGSPVLLDSSVTVGESRSSHPIIGRSEAALASGTTIEAIGELARGDAVEKMQAGIRELTLALADSNRIQGAICIGGAGAHIAGPAFQELPIGFPKLVVSPLASGRRQFEPYVGLRDVAVMHSVADIAGINDITERVYRSAAGYIVGAAGVGAAQRNAEADGQARPTVAISMNGNTTKAMDRGRARLVAAGWTVVTFHANGVGGRALEDFVASGRAAAVLDYTTTELGASVVGGLMDAGAGRMETAGRNGLPQVLVPGCVDFITCGTWAEAEEEFPNRIMFRHNPELTLVRLLPDEMAQLGSLFARKANLAVGPTSILVPKRGFSVSDVEGGPFWDPVADAAFVEALLAEVGDRAAIELIDAHINDNSFSDAAVDGLIALAKDAADPIAVVGQSSNRTVV
jgi:uncharacterized protein (UPF0261 family)